MASTTSAQKTSVLLEFGESKKLICIPNYNEDEAPEDVLDTVEGHLKRNVWLMIDYGAQSSSESQRTGATYILQRFSENLSRG